MVVQVTWKQSGRQKTKNGISGTPMNTPDMHDDAARDSATIKKGRRQ